MGELTPTAAATSARVRPAMVRSGDHQICFRLADALPAVSLPGPLRLGDAQAEALSELLQVFACGEESASLAFARLGDSPIARPALARVAEEELIHELLRRRLCWGWACLRKLEHRCRAAVRAYRPRAERALLVTAPFSPPAELLTAVEGRFGLALHRRGMAIAHKLGIRTRHLCRNMRTRL